VVAALVVFDFDGGMGDFEGARELSFDFANGQARVRADSHARV
jgi:hypothetical protein